ncbi:MAG: ketose-bisphosphate aldolase [Lachnospirales bacterium]
MSLASLKKILGDAKDNGYAIPGFDVLEKTSAEAVVMAAEKTNSPVILMVPEAALPLIDAAEHFEFLAALAKKAKVPVALELDHGKDIEVIKKAIDAGFTSVMIDGSELPFDENVALTKKVVEIAHASNVCVEAEIGHVAGGEGNMDGGSSVDESMYTKPLDAKRFVEETNVDALAIAFGTVHGMYKGTPKLNLKLLEEIKTMVDVPLVMHGGSGVSDEEFKKAVKSGINKVNFFTEISMLAVSSSVEHCIKKENKLHFVELITVAKNSVALKVEHYINLLK